MLAKFDPVCVFYCVRYNEDTKDILTQRKMVEWLAVHYMYPETRKDIDAQELYLLSSTGQIKNCTGQLSVKYWHMFFWLRGGGLPKILIQNTKFNGGETSAHGVVPTHSWRKKSS